MTQPSVKRPWNAARWSLPALALAGVVWVLAGACSTPKAAVEERLLALPGHEAVRDLGLEHLKTTMELEGQPVDVEFTWLRFEPSDGRPPGQRPPLVLVHGTPGSLFTWVDLAGAEVDGRRLADDFDVYAFDVVGHGSTRGGGSPMSFQRGADFVTGAIEALGLTGVALVGHSYGGEFCWRAALDRPDLIARLVLIDSSGYTREPGGFLPEEVAMREYSLAKLGYLLNSRARIATALQPHFDAPVQGTRVDALYIVCGNKENWGAMVDLARDEEGRRQGELSALTMPVLLLWGSQDLAYPPDPYVRRFERDIPGARTVLVEGAGHYPHEERPGEAARHLRAFLLDAQ